MNLPLPTQAYLRECLMYFPVSGRLFWRHRPQHHFNSYRAFITWNAQHALHEAFATSDKDGYRTGRLDGRTYKAHRIIFKLLHNSEPPRVDHIDGNRLNNRIENLRSVSRRENLQNMACHRSGHLPGTCFFKERGVWRAAAWVEGKQIYIGYFETREQAHTAYRNFIAAEGRSAQ